MSTAPEAVPPDRAGVESRDLLKWQRKLLPFMTRFLVVLAFVFFALTLFNVYEMRSFVQDDAGQSVRERIDARMQRQDKSSNLVQESLLLLEAEAMDKRYRQASALLVSRIWTRQLAFMTGMVLAFIGAVFILGKLSEAQTNASLGTEQLKTAISSSSPGLILAFFGTTLIALSIVIQPTIGVQDRPIYFVTMGLVPKNGSAPATQPPASNEIDPGPLDPGLSAPNEPDAPEAPDVPAQQESPEQ